MFYFYLQDIASHKFLAVGGLREDTLTLVEDRQWATAWSERKAAQNYADTLHNDFTHELAGTTFEVIASRF